MAEKRLNTEEAARYLKSKGVKRTTRTLISWRDTGQGPAYYKLSSGAVYYKEEDLDKFLVGNRVEPKRG